MLQNSAKIIRASVFGMDENKKVREKFMFSQNNLVVTSIDIQSVEPVDQRTRDSLQKSVQLAIEITTNSQEAAARSVLVAVAFLGAGYKYSYLLTYFTQLMWDSGKNFAADHKLWQKCVSLRPNRAGLSNR